MSSSNYVRVTIEGNSKSEKTALAMLLSTALQEAGVGVVVFEDGGTFLNLVSGAADFDRILSSVQGIQGCVSVVTKLVE